MNIVRFFQSAVIIKFFILIYYGASALYIKNPFEEINENLPNWYNNSDSDSVLFIGSIFIILTVILSILAVLMYKKAVYLYTIFVTFDFLFNFTVYSEIETPISHGITSIDYAINGFLLGVVFFSSLKEKLK